MGDVALTVPSIRGLLHSNEKLRITLATKKIYFPFFYGIPRLTLFEGDFKARHKGFLGLIRLFFDLKKTGSYDYVIDLHNVLRTWILSFLFKLSGARVRTIFKGRKDKEGLLQGKKYGPLKSTTGRYLETFKSVQIELTSAAVPVLSFSPESEKEATKFIDDHNLTKDQTWIGIAPFALHKLKTWPLNNVTRLIELIKQNSDSKILLFGGGMKEKANLDEVIGGNENCIGVIGELSLGAEIALIKKLDFMISMDSGNMHIAALVGTKTVSIWGGTHPFAGFEAYQQNPAYMIQVSKEKLPCRPCTIYGKGECKRDDFACMEWISPADVYNKLVDLKLLPIKPAES